MTHITDAIQARRIAAYRAATETLPEKERNILAYWRDALAADLLAADRKLSDGLAQLRADAVIADILWRAG